MSVVEYPNGSNPADLQIWDNAAFDNGDSLDLSSMKRSWSPLEPLLVNPSDSFESDISSKENQTPSFDNSSVNSSVNNLSSLMPIKPLHPDGAVEKSRFKPNKPISKQSLDFRDERKIDEEIKEIEMEISRLNSRLKALRLEKVEKCVKRSVEKRGRIVAAKFMEPKQTVKIANEKKKSEESSSVSGKKVERRRGVSLGPSEIFSGARRGLSMGPSEIFAKRLGKQEMVTPFQPITNRRKSCFWTLQEIQEESLSKERGKSSSLKAAAMASARQAVTSIASKKNLKKDGGLSSFVQPKKLFKEGEKCAVTTNKKPQRPGRVVASRYNQSSVARKRSLPENDKDESKRNDKKRSLSIGKSQSESRVKKKWEIPSEILVHGSTESQKSPVSIAVKPDLLPRIRIARCANETPRDSGPAKRVAELIGKKSYFNTDEDKEPSVCQVLSFADEEE